MEQKLDLNRRNVTRTSLDAPALPMNAIWRTIRSYILWSYERGTIHYDIMVTLILLFVFLTPYWINYKDKPAERNPHPTGVSVLPDTQGGFLYQIEGAAVTAKDDAAIREQLMGVIEPIAGGAVTITKYETVRDHSGRILSYKVWVQRSM
ncbi:MAG TPA: hypothetical protein VEV41_13495 [Terriglobales bacterium]|nr:hypothetical protein [Terriglobales bacterium]